MTVLPPGKDVRERVDTAQVLTRFHHLERALTIACAGWIPAAPLLEQKAALARTAWQCALAADALRERVFELRYPSRLLEEGAHEPTIRVYEAAIRAPDPDSFVCGLSEVLIPSLLGEYWAFLEATDALDDGPTLRILEAAARDKDEQMYELAAETGDGAWPDELRRGLDALEPPAGTPFAIAEDPARDDRYAVSSFYWPDTLDPTYPYGEGIALQLRSAVSHLNEVWAVETAGVILHELADELGWEFVRDAARWVYDESRHMLMGKRRLEAWGLDPAGIPLGGYIYEACKGEDPIYRLGMLGYFETKNIGRKRERAQAFATMGDTLSEADMEFDWADETIHAEYGRRWLKELLGARGEDEEGWPAILEHCEQLVRARVARATPEEAAEIRRIAEALVAEAAGRAV